MLVSRIDCQQLSRTFEELHVVLLCASESPAKLTGNAKLQLQLAARDGAARQVYESTGIDVRAKVDRLKPAVLRMNPPKDVNGIRLLKNENENRLFYFLQVSEVDFASGVSCVLFEKLWKGCWLLA